MKILVLPGDGIGEAITAATVDTTLADPAKRTADLKGPLGTKAFTAAVPEALDSVPDTTDIG